MGLMDMFSVRDIRSFGTGFLGAKVEAMQESARVAAEEKKFNDELKAKRISSIEEHEAKAGIDADILAKQEEEKIKKRKLYLASYLGVPESWIERHAGIALESPNMMKLWLDSQAQIYGRNDWFSAPIKNGYYKGLTVPEWIDQTGSGNFDNATVGQVVSKENLNGLDNTKNVVLDQEGTSTTSAKDINSLSVSLDERKDLKGKALFSIPQKYLKSKGEYMFSTQYPNGIYTYKVSQTPGKDDWGPTLYHDTIEDGKVVTSTLPTNNITWYDADHDIAKKIISQNLGLFDKAELQEHMVKIKGKNYSFVTKNTTSSFGEIEQNIVRIDPDLAKILKIPLIDESPIGEPPDVYSKVKKEVNDLNIPLNWLIAAADDQGLDLNIRSFDSTEFYNSNKALYESQDFPKAGSTDRNRLYTSFLQGAGFETMDKNNNNIYAGIENEITRTHSFSVYPDTDQGKAAASGIKILDNSFAMIYNLSRNVNLLEDSNAGKIPTIIADELGINTNVQTLDYSDFVSKLSTYYQDFRRIRGNQELAQLEIEKANGTLASYLENHQHGTGLNEDTKIEELASSIVDRELATITTLDDLIFSKLEIDKRVDTQLEEQKTDAILTEQQLFNNIFPDSEREIGNTLENFVDYYVGDTVEALTDPDQAELLKAGIEGITMNSAEYTVIHNRAKEYLENKMEIALKERKDGDIIVSKSDLDQSDKSEKLIKTETKNRNEVVDFISFYEKEVEDKKLEINNLKEKSKNDEMLQVLLQPLEQELLNLQQTLVEYQQQLQILDKGWATKRTNLLEEEINK